MKKLLALLFSFAVFNAFAGEEMFMKELIYVEEPVGPVEAVVDDAGMLTEDVVEGAGEVAGNLVEDVAEAPANILNSLF